MSIIKGIWTCLISRSESLQRSSQCLSIIHNTAYVFGGELEPREPRDNAIYAVNLDDATQGNVNIDTFSLPNAPTPRVGASSIALGGKLYLFGGRGGVSMTCLESKGSFSVYDAISTPAWSNIRPRHDSTSGSATFPEDRSYLAITSDNENTIYLHAGCPASGRLNDLWAFDVPTRKWKQLASAPGNARGGTSITFLTSTRKLYRMNGFDGNTEQGGVVDVYDPEQDRWSSIEYKADGINGPEPRSVAALVPARAKSGKEFLVTLFGEGAPSSLGHAGAGRMFGDTWAWSVKDEIWSRVEGEGQSPKPRGWFDADIWAAADARADGVIVHGGLHDSNERLNDIWMLQLV